MKNSHPLYKGAGAAVQPLHPNSFRAQESRLLVAMRRAGPAGVSSIQARERVGIYTPTRIIHRLRRKHGYKILTYMADDTDLAGRVHRVAHYVLVTSIATPRSVI